MDFQIEKIDVLNATITYTVDGNEVVEELTLANLINVIIEFVNALIKFEF